MPILAEEPALYPASLFEICQQPATERRWWALYTKARQEKAVARQLHKWQVPFYLPLVPKNLLYRGRRITSHVPLFTAYMFLYGTEDERVRTLTTNRLSKVIEVVDQHQLAHDLRQVQRLIESKAPLTVESRIEPGRRVRIKSGAFMGLEGMVIARLKETRLVLTVNFLQKGVSVEIDDFLLEPLD